MESASIVLVKDRGSESCRRSIRASDTTAALNAMGVLVRELANMLDVSVDRVLAMLTVTLTVPAIRAEREGGGEA